MEAVEKRSDFKSKLIAATPSQVFAAMSDPVRIARWWGPAGFANTIHQFEFKPGGRWLLTMHGPDGKDYPSDNRFVRIAVDRTLEIEHLTGHHFVLTMELEHKGDATLVRWQQTFDTVGQYQRVAEFITVANEQNLERLAAEVHAPPR
jgi:uncharacterized protein YndB with AHSA1/START domain